MISGDSINFGFKKPERLQKSSEFSRVFRNGRKRVGNLMLIYYAENNLGFPRAGFIASKRFSKKAVERNRAKRLMREVFRLNKHNLPPFDIIFIAKKGLIGRKFSDVEKDFKNLVRDWLGR